jgi:hypothetical protein
VFLHTAALVLQHHGRTINREEKEKKIKSAISILRIVFREMAITMEKRRTQRSPQKFDGRLD